MEIAAAQQGEHGDAAAYVLGALDPAARERFEGHAAVCAACRREVEQLRPVAEELGIGVPQVDPPPALKRAVLASALEQMAAEEDGAAADAPFGAGPVATVATSPARFAPPARASAPRRWLLGERVATALAAASLLVAAGGTAYAMAAHQQVEQTAHTAAQLMETLSIIYQPGMVGKMLTASDAWPGAKGKLFMVPESPDAVVITYDMPRLGRNEAYQFWLANPDQNQRISGGVFRVDDRGRGHLLVRSNGALNQWRSCGVTKEPAKGSQWPTGPRVLSGQL